MLIRYFAQAADWAGCAEEQVECPGTTGLRQVLELLAGRHGPDFQRKVYDPSSGHTSDDCFLLINGVHAARLNGLDTLVGDADSLSVLPLIEAG